MFRISIRAGEHHGQAGFFIAWRDPRRAWPQRIFTESRDVAERLKAAVKRDASFAELNAILCERS